MKSMKLPHMIKEPSLKKRWLLFFLLGICLGILFANFLGNRYIDKISLLSDYMLLKYQRMDLRQERMFRYCLEARVLPMCYIWIFGLTMFASVVGYLYVMWFGFTAGALLSMATMRFGVKGIALCLCGVLPQYLVYVPVMLALLALSFTTGNRLYGKGGVRGTIYGGKRKLVGKYFLVFLLLLVVCITGIFLESYVNPYLLKKMLKLF